MLYYLYEFKDLFSGFNIFRYITFRAGMAAVTTFMVCLIMGPYFIRILRERKFQEVAKRADAPDLDKFQHSKQGTPTMGGIFIIGSILLSVFLWADLRNPYILMTSFTCFSLAVLGFSDDYSKLVQPVTVKQRGLKKRTKLLWQILISSAVGAFVFVNPDTSTILSFPFFKHLLIDLGILYVPFVAIILIGASNAVNLTDGLDGLAIGCVLVVSITMGVLCYIVGNIFFSEYLFLPFIKGAGELTVFCAAMVGACLGFLWFNCYPASVFMGDTGSLALGGTLGAIAVFIKNEMLLVILGGVFVLETVSVIMQVTSFKLTGKRIFKMTPFHHHLQLSGWKESQIITRLWIIAIVLAFIALTTLKVR